MIGNSRIYLVNALPMTVPQIKAHSYKHV